MRKCWDLILHSGLVAITHEAITNDQIKCKIVSQNENEPMPVSFLRAVVETKQMFVNMQSDGMYPIQFEIEFDGRIKKVNESPTFHTAFWGCYHIGLGILFYYVIV